MGDTSALDLQFGGVFAHSGQLAIVPALVTKLIDENEDHTLVYYRYGGTWYLFKTDKAVISVCYPSQADLEMALLTTDGEVIRLRKGNREVEVIDDSDDGPSDLVVMRDIKIIDGVQFAVGMARLAYRKVPGSERWDRIDATCFVPRAQRDSSVGFYSIDGFSGADIYAVGYKGEIWTFDGSQWVMRPSPTNVVLTNVICDHASGRVVIAGLAGTLLIGRDDEWLEVEQDLTRADFWGAAAFRGHVYLASNDGVFRLSGEELERVEIDGSVTTSYLSAVEDVMWSVGSKDILVTQDGVSWDRVENP